MTVGTAADPLRVAIIGSGPSGFYAADELLSREGVHVQVDMFDRLPTPFGLVRGGVAPDHQKIKSVTRVYDKTAARPGFRFHGNVEFGRDLTHADLTAYFHAIVYAVGARSDRRMNVPGEHLPGSHSATDFVGWYNGHPDFRRLSFDLSGRHAVVVGAGNVAMDVARILATPVDELEKTDIADHALEALAESRIEEITILARRGPAQAAFTTPEIKEMGRIPGVQAVCDPGEVAIDADTEAEIAGDKTRRQNIEVLQSYATAAPGPGRRVALRFLVSPVTILGEDRVEAVVCARNVLHRSEDGWVSARHTDARITFPADILFRAIGYQGTPLPSVPFDASRGVVPNREGRVHDPSRDDDAIVGEYAVGWIKRGPQGVIGTNKADSQETVASLFADLDAGVIGGRAVPGRDVFDRLLAERCADVVTWDDWRRLDAIEVARGAERGRPRVKLTSVAEMTEALAATPVE